jgi:hypothetical protein
MLIPALWLHIMQQRDNAHEIKYDENGEHANDADQENFESKALFVVSQGFLDHPDCYQYYQPHHKNGNSHQAIKGII